MIGYGWFNIYLWIGIEVGVEGFENRKKQDVVWVKNPNDVRTYIVYGPKISYQSLMNLFLYKTRHLEVSNHINYKAIRLALSEL